MQTCLCNWMFVCVCVSDLCLYLRTDTHPLCVSLWPTDLPGGHDALAVTKLPPRVSCHQRDIHRPGLTPPTPSRQASLQLTTRPHAYPLPSPLRTWTGWQQGGSPFHVGPAMLAKKQPPGRRGRLAIFSISAGMCSKTVGLKAAVLLRMYHSDT